MGQEKLEKERAKNEALQRKLQEMETNHKLALKQAKADLSAIAADRDDIAKQLTRSQNKETQYRHELRGLEVQVDRLQNQVKSYIFKDK